jgi:hypothetical protein
MPTKTKPRRAPGIFDAQRIVLPDKTKRELCHQLAFASDSEQASEMLKGAEQILSSTEWLALIIRSKPRPAHVKAALEQIRSHAEPLLKCLKSLDAESQGLLLGSALGDVGRALLKSEPGLPAFLNPRELVDELPPLLELLVTGCKCYIEALDKVESRQGSPRLVPYREARKQLGLLFDRYATPQTRKNRDAFIDFAVLEASSLRQSA